MIRRLYLSVVWPATLLASLQVNQPKPDPVFDAHLHIGTTPASRAGIRAAMDSLGIVGAAYIGTSLQLDSLPPERLAIPGLLMPCDSGRSANSGLRCFKEDATFPDTLWLREEVRAGRVKMLGELLSQYIGVTADDPRLDPYYRLAQEFDLPIGIHLGIGPTGVAYEGRPGFPVRKSPKYRGRAGSPLQLEDVLVRYPRLRVYVMHAAWPFLDDMLYMLYMHPNLHVDISVLQFAIPSTSYEQYLRTLVDAGFAKRILWGSDGGPRQMAQGVRSIREASFLSSEQKRDILYANAMRFFGFMKDSTAVRR